MRLHDFGEGSCLFFAETDSEFMVLRKDMLLGDLVQEIGKVTEVQLLVIFSQLGQNPPDSIRLIVAIFQ